MEYVFGHMKKECEKPGKLDTKLLPVQLANRMITCRVIFSTGKNSFASLLDKTLINMSMFYK